jgi:hypothetical protein
MIIALLLLCATLSRNLDPGHSFGEKPAVLVNNRKIILAIYLNFKAISLILNAVIETTDMPSLIYPIKLTGR